MPKKLTTQKSSSLHPLLKTQSRMSRWRRWSWRVYCQASNEGACLEGKERVWL